MSTAPRKMFLVIKGGLGNQMFQAAFGQIIKNKIKCEIEYISFTKSARVSREWALSCFGINASEISTYKKLLVLLAVWIKRKLIKININFPSGIIIDYHKPNTLISQSIKSAFIVDGYWQSYTYFHNNRAELIQLFDFPSAAEFPIPIPEDLPKIAIHVRRGDYVTDPIAKKNHLVCDINWYRDAWNLMRKFTPNNSIVLIFSDDIAWAKNNINFDPSFLYIPNDPNKEPWVDMSLMKSCDHFIVSNSSFSWWGAYLGEKTNSIVIAPKFWYPNITTTSLKICPENWLLA